MAINKFQASYERYIIYDQPVIDHEHAKFIINVMRRTII